MIVAACHEARSGATNATTTTFDIDAPPSRTCRQSILSVPPGGSLTASAPLHPPRSSSLKCGGGGRIQSSVSYPLRKVCTRVYGERIKALFGVTHCVGIITFNSTQKRPTLVLGLSTPMNLEIARCSHLK